MRSQRLSLLVEKCTAVLPLRTEITRLRSEDYKPLNGSVLSDQLESPGPSAQSDVRTTCGIAADGQAYAEPFHARRRALEGRHFQFGIDDCEKNVTLGACEAPGCLPSYVFADSPRIRGVAQ